MACQRILAIAESSEDQRLIVGFGIEYEAEPDGHGSFMPHQGSNQIDVIQIAMSDVVYVFKVTAFHTRAAVPSNLLALLLSNQVIKVGGTVTADLKLVAKFWLIEELISQLTQNPDNVVVELGVMTKLKGVTTTTQTSTSALSGIILKRSLDRPSTIHLSKWSLFPLSEEQKRFAALDAYTSLCIWKQLFTMVSVNQPVLNPEHGQLVNILGGRKKVVAHGKIVINGNERRIELPHRDGKKKMGITPHRLLVEVDEILVPQFEPGLHKIPLTEMGPTPFHLLVDEDGYDIDYKFEEIIRNTDIDTLSVPPTTAPPSTQPSPQPSTLPLAPLSTGISTSLTQPADVPPEGMATRTIDDNWHVQDHLMSKLSRSHSAYKPFAQALSWTMLVYDEQDHKRFEEVIIAHGWKWEDMLEAKPDAVNCCVHRYCPPPDTLYQSLKVLFESWQDVQCSLDPNHGVLFSQKARKQAENILKVVQLGLVSDPPGIPLYFQDSGVLPSFTIPECLVTRIATSEKFGIIPIPQSIIQKYHFEKASQQISSSGVPKQDGIPVHLLTHLSTKPVSPYEYLAKQQQTVVPIIPIHTEAKYNLFTELLTSGDYYTAESQLKAPSAWRTDLAVNFDKLAKDWSKKVHVSMNQSLSQIEKIYHKLPEQLERYHKAWVLA
ncbi:hypothetical protein JAAARDRAFT_43247 [Jaapia argillacea MUCL 33604]|uniref:3'-5' exonuclease domain-containing protein n=1 Tax=Jaapia argillacea MUCL 33604 TaxID=933084 RepID=A0A067QAM3_9AGAM|nr:hypothetical protein JAAARDRAFT_43247 [Jaapia argillacea MUCL 33604]